MGNTTSKVLQTDSAYLPESLVRFLLIVQYEMLSSWPLGSPVVTYYFDSTATNSIGLQSILLHGPQTATTRPRCISPSPFAWRMKYNLARFVWFSYAALSFTGSTDARPS